MICSTLSGMIVIKHPTLGVLVREDGMVLTGGKRKAYEWTKGTLRSDGYRRVRIQWKNYYVHRLVAETFIPNPDMKPTVDHINRNKDDNRVCNLRWASHKEQVENSGKVLNRAYYGFRACENLSGWTREYYQAHKEERLEYARKYREKKKQETLEATDFA